MLRLSDKVANFGAIHFINVEKYFIAMIFKCKNRMPMYEETFVECANNLLELLKSVEKIIKNPKEITEKDLNEFKDTITLIHSAVNK